MPGGANAVDAETEIADLVNTRRQRLLAAITARRVEMRGDDRAYLRLFEALGVPRDEAAAMEEGQSVARLVYRAAGEVMESAARIAIAATKGGARAKIPNPAAGGPKRYEIDCLVESDLRAHEIKWRSASTDGDHVRKEIAKAHAIAELGYKPVRLVFYEAARISSRRAQGRVEDAYRDLGECHVGSAAWDYVSDYTGVDLRRALGLRDKGHRMLAPSLVRR